MEIGEAQPALEDFKICLESSTDNDRGKLVQRLVNVYIVIANSLWDKGHINHAFDHFDSALELAPEDVETLQNIVACKEKLGLIDESIIQHENILLIDAANEVSRSALARLCCIKGLQYMKLESYNQALEWYTKALKISN